MNAYTSSSSLSAMSVARGAIGSWSTSPASSDPTDCSSGGRPVLTLSALPLQVTGEAEGSSPLSDWNDKGGRGTAPAPLCACLSTRAGAAASRAAATGDSQSRAGPGLGRLGQGRG